MNQVSMERYSSLSPANGLLFTAQWWKATANHHRLLCHEILLIMSTNNAKGVMTLDSESSRPECVFNNTGEERTDDICLGINHAVTLNLQGHVEADNPKDSDARRNLWKINYTV